MRIRQVDDVTILRVNRPEEAIQYRASFVGAYQTVFAEPPYNEHFTASEAEAVLQRVLQTPGHITLLAVRGVTQCVGFGFAVPLSARPDVWRHMLGLLPVEHTIYLAELGVVPEYRGRGLAGHLIEERLNLVDRSRFSHVLLRTSAAKHAGYSIYLKRGFVDTGVYMEVPARRTGGNVSTDRRLFLSKVL